MKLVTSGVCAPGVDAGEKMSNKFMNDLGDRTKIIFSKFVDDRRD